MASDGTVGVRPAQRRGLNLTIHATRTPPTPTGAAASSCLRVGCRLVDSPGGGWYGIPTDGPRAYTASGSPCCVRERTATSVVFFFLVNDTLTIQYHFRIAADTTSQSLQGILRLFEYTTFTIKNTVKPNKRHGGFQQYTLMQPYIKTGIHRYLW